MSGASIAEKIIQFNKTLQGGINIPPGVQLLNPFENKDVRILSEKFYKKFFSDSKKRIFILGINPGRFGAGATGIPFTDPVNLEEFCGIPNDLNKRHELSSIFVYEIINAFGGPVQFYKKFLITAVCPLGFTRDQKNINYYDDPGLRKAVEPFIIHTLRKQIEFGTNQKTALILGEGKNYKYFGQLNEQFEFFQDLIPLPHPRFILQYRRKRKQEYIHRYLDALQLAVTLSKS